MMEDTNPASHASAWEAVCIAETRKTCEIRSRKTHGLERAGLSPEDMVQILQMEVIVACRNWAHKSSDKPPKAFLSAAISRRQSKIWDKCKRAQQRTGRLPDHVEDVGEAKSIAVDDNTFEDSDREQALQTLEQAVSMVVAPNHFALMRLRAAGWGPTEIAGMTGIERKQVLDRISRARKKAREFLKACGIEKMQDAELLDVEVMDGVWKRAERRNRERVDPTR